MSARKVGSGLGGLTPRSEPGLLALISRIQDATSRLASACNNADEIGNRLFGSAPLMTIGPSHEGPASDGIIPALDAATDALHERITVLDCAMQRLNQL